MTVNYQRSAEAVLFLDLKVVVDVHLKGAVASEPAPLRTPTVFTNRPYRTRVNCISPHVEGWHLPLQSVEDEEASKRAPGPSASETWLQPDESVPGLVEFCSLSGEASRSLVQAAG